MSIRNLNKIFQPQSVAVVGASDTLAKVGNTVLRNLVECGFAGDIFPVNAKHDVVQGRPAFRSIAGIPRPVDLAVICTPAPTVPTVVRECGEAGIMGLVILTAGFRETGAAGRAAEQQIKDEQRRFPGMRIIGPNCLGVIAPAARLNASFAIGMPKVGSVAFLSQSGALCTAVLDWARRDEIGFSHFVSLGNTLDVGLGDLIDYFAEDPHTKSAILYVESIQDARGFMSAARAFARQKPIVAYKAGRFAESAKAAASHTGAMAGVDAVYEAAFHRAGIERVFEIDEMFHCAELLARQPTPRGARLAIVTNAGGPGVMATDTLLECRGELATLAAETIAQLDECLPFCWSHGNPVDVLGDASAERFGRAVEIVQADPNVDAVLAILTPQAMTDPTGTAAALAALAKRGDKLVLAAWMGAELVEAGVRLLNQARVPTYPTPEKAVRAFMHLVSFGRHREVLYETPRAVPVTFPAARETERERVRSILAQGESTILSEADSKSLLAAYGIPSTQPLAAASAEEAAAVAARLGYPVVMKILSPQITHKTDVGGVALNLKSDDEVRAMFTRMTDTARQRRPDARIDGVTLQRMVTAVHAAELILGAKRDPVFGTVIMAGMGGIAAELFQDRALELPPLNERLARQMLMSLRTWPLLAGYRGRRGVNVDRVVETLIRFSYLLADYPEIHECDINPVLATADEVIALDARVVIRRDEPGEKPRPYAHLAIRPYPDEFVREATLKDGTRVLLRPIKPEDEPAWHALVAACSQESLFSRFGYLFRTTTHEMATRFCFLDYDRETAIVAELGDGDARQLVGVGRLIADVDHQAAEFAVLVTDAWQGRGLGTLLTQHCLEVAKEWGGCAESPRKPAP